MKAAHCSSLSERSGGGQGLRTQDLQACDLPSQPSLVRQTLRLDWRPSEPQDLEHLDQGDHGDQEEWRTVWTLSGELEMEGSGRERVRPRI